MIDYLQQIHGGTGDHVQVRCEFLTKLDHKWTQKVLWLVWMFLKKKKKTFFSFKAYGKDLWLIMMVLHMRWPLKFEVFRVMFENITLTNSDLFHWILVECIHVFIHIFHWFSAIGNAYAVLSDADKRKKYDVYGPDLQQASQHTADYTHGGFEGRSIITNIH